MRLDRDEAQEKMISMRPACFYYRARARALPEDTRALVLELVEELEALKKWVRDKTGMAPPSFSIPEEKLRDIMEEPTTQFQMRLADEIRDAPG